MSQKEQHTEETAELNSENTNEYILPEEKIQMLEQVNAAVKRPTVAIAGRVLLIALLISAIIIFITGIIRYSELANDRDALQQQVYEKEESVEEKEYLLDVPLTDKDYIIRVAKEKLGLFLPDEIVYYSDLNE